MNSDADVSPLLNATQAVEAWLNANVLQASSLVQLALILLALIVAAAFGRKLKARLVALDQDTEVRGIFTRTILPAAEVAVPGTWLIFNWLMLLFAKASQLPHQVIGIGTSLLTAWVVIRLASHVIREPVWARVLAVSAWTIAALSILNLLSPTVELLDSVAFIIGDSRISVLAVMKGILSMVLLVWVAVIVSDIVERRVQSLPNLTPSVRVLFGKLTKVALIVLAVVVALETIGIDLTAFAVFSGALGVGIGFGLQKIVSNLISGVILLLDKSIKPGDVIAVGDYYGWIDSLGARYASVVTRDGVELLIPNEDLITQRVENWSHSNRFVRLHIPVGVSYNADVRLAMQLCLDAAASAARVLKEPPSTCLLRGFGDNSVDLELRVWIEDPEKGRANVTSEVLLGVWDRFKESGIEIPFPQRDLHVRSVADGTAAAVLQGLSPDLGKPPTDS